MPQKGFEISITTESVDMRRNVHFLVQRYGTYIGIPYMALAVAGFYWIVFSSHGASPSIWELVTRYGSQDHEFGDAVLGLVIIAPLLGWTFFLGARTLFPSGEALHCDRSTFTVSKIPWFNLRGKWKTHSYPLSEISELRFARILRNKSGNAFMGLRFLAAGKKQKLFTGLEAPEAHKILKGLHALGVDVPNDPDMRYRIADELRERRIKLDNRT